MPKKTDRLKSYVELARDFDRETRAALVTVLQEEDAINRASRANVNDLVKKYGLEDN